MFLDLLPLLLHCNHPGLPGYVSATTPAGIPDYQPNRRALSAARVLSKSFEYKKRARQEFPILALFLMGSVGSIAYSGKSDLDIWLCHHADLDDNGLDELRQKATLIEQWAETLGVEAHVFFVEPDRFRAGQGTPISTESCGNVQHHLLLEEFYRTSLWLAGRAPAWWLVPPQCESSYSAYLNHLVDNRFVNPGDIIDLGGLENVSADEFLGGTLWHLNKAVLSPHKSLLKLLLMESYDADYPNVDWLCTRLKAAIHAGERRLEALDSYVLMYRKVEQYLQQRGESERLELARRSFYLKVSEPFSSVHGAQAEREMRQQVLDGMAKIWQWPVERLRDLDGRHLWPVARAVRDHRAIANELNLSYHGIKRFAAEHGGLDGSSGEEIKLLGRRLSAALERRPGKIERLHLYRREFVDSDSFSLVASPTGEGDTGWALCPGRLNGSGPSEMQIIKQSGNLLELLAWVVSNGFYRRGTQFFLDPAEDRISANELRGCLDALSGLLKKLPEESQSLDAYARAPRVEAVALFVNLGLDVEAERRDGLCIASSRSDAISYGSGRGNLVRRVEALTLNSWRELQVTRYDDLDGLFTCLSGLVEQPGPAPRFDCFCFAPLRAHTVMSRVRRLYAELRGHLGGGTDGLGRLMVRGGSGFYLFERHGVAVRYRELVNEDAMIHDLSAPRPRFAPMTFDADCDLPRSPLPAIYALNRPGVVQIFCLPEGNEVRVFALDERGSLYQRRHETINPQWLLGPYAVLLDAMRVRKRLNASSVEYYLIEQHRGAYAISAAGFRPSGAAPGLPVRISARHNPAGRTTYSILVKEREFAGENDDPELFRGAAEFVRQLRSGGERYPVYITDIDVPPPILGVDRIEDLQGIHILQYKRKIEERLNA